MFFHNKNFDNTSTFMEYWGRAWADFCGAHKLTVQYKSSLQFCSVAVLNAVYMYTTYTQAKATSCGRVVAF